MKKSENFLIFITFIFCIVFAEFGLRIFEDQNHSVYPKGLFVKDKKNGYKLAKNFEGKHVFQDFSYNVKTNKYGCFENEINRKNAEILIVGDSHVWGFVRSEDRYSSILRNKYNINSCYDPCSYPGIQSDFYYNIKDSHYIQNGIQPLENKENFKKISFMIFRTGSVLMVGKCTENELVNIYNYIRNILYEEYSKIYVRENVEDINKQKDKEKKHKKKNIYIQ